MLDNLVFYYDASKYDEVSERLKNRTHSFEVYWKLTQLGDRVWKKCYSILLTYPMPLFINNFHSIGEHGVLRCFTLQIDWFNFVNTPLHEINGVEWRILQFMLDLLEDINIERWHFESTIAVGRSQAIYENIIKPLEELGWKIKQLQPDPEKILSRDKFLLWHLVHPSRKIFVKGYVANAMKYPKCFENMTKVELCLPVISLPENADRKCFEDILVHTHYIRACLVSEDLIRETAQIIWAKAIVQPVVNTWFNNSNSLSLAWFFQKFSQETIVPFPYVYTSFEETLDLLKNIYHELLGRSEGGRKNG